MKAAIVGLGKMGGNMARRLLAGGHQIIGYNRSSEVTKCLAKSDGLIPVFTLEELVQNLPSPRIIWIMVPAGNPTDMIVNSLGDLLDDGDILIDGGNSNYKETIQTRKYYYQHVKDYYPNQLDHST